MNIKILDSILHGELKPWKVDTSNTRHFAELIKAAKTNMPETISELTQKLAALLNDSPALLASIKKGPGPTTQALQQLPFSTDLLAYRDAVTQYYFMLINHEALHYYNNVLEQSTAWTDSIDLNYQTNKVFKSLIILAKQTSEELTEGNYITTPDNKSDLPHLVLYYLKQTLIILHQSLQLKFEDRLETKTSLEDLYLLELEEPVENVLKINLNSLKIAEPGQKKSNVKKLTFGFNGDRIKLRTVINQLCLKASLLNETLSPADFFLQLLLSNDIKPGEKKIYFDCDNNDVRRVIDNLSKYFKSLSLINISRSQSFYSKGNTLLKENNLSKAHPHEAKQKEEIDNIFKQMQ